MNASDVRVILPWCGASVKLTTYFLFYQLRMYGVDLELDAEGEICLLPGQHTLPSKYEHNLLSQMSTCMTELRLLIVDEAVGFGVVH